MTWRLSGSSLSLVEQRGIKAIVSVYSGQSPGLGSRPPRNPESESDQCTQPYCQTVNFLRERTFPPQTTAHLSIMSTSVALFEHDITTGCTCKLGIILASRKLKCAAWRSTLYLQRAQPYTSMNHWRNDQPNTSTCATTSKVWTARARLQRARSSALVIGIPQGKRSTRTDPTRLICSLAYA
jgi:hypothetical protein